MKICALPGCDNPVTSQAYNARFCCSKHAQIVNAALSNARAKARRERTDQCYGGMPPMAKIMQNIEQVVANALMREEVPPDAMSETWRGRELRAKRIG